MLSRPRRCRIPPHPHDISRRCPSVDGTRMTYGDIHQKSIGAARYEHFFGIHEAGAGFSGSLRLRPGSTSSACLPLHILTERSIDARLIPLVGG